jgi:hypothetical protein
MVAVGHEYSKTHRKYYNHVSSVNVCFLASFSFFREKRKMLV